MKIGPINKAANNAASDRNTVPAVVVVPLNTIAITIQKIKATNMPAVTRGGHG